MRLTRSAYIGTAGQEKQGERAESALLQGGQRC